MAQGLEKYKVGYEMHCGEKELASFRIQFVPFPEYVPFYVYIFSQIIVEFFFLHSFASRPLFPSVRFRNDSCVRNAWSDY